MGNSTKSGLLFFFMVVFLSSFSLKNKEMQIKPPAPNSLSASTISFHSISNGSLIYGVATFSAEETVFSKKTPLNQHVKNKLIKYRKKFKRTSNIYSGIRPPSKELPPGTFNLFSKVTYTRPHFLSHLHHFLFRLTPF